MSRRKRSGQWFGDSFLKTLEPSAVAQITTLLPSSTILESARDVVFERCIISFQTRRVSSSTCEGCAFIVWDGSFLSGSTTPSEALDPLSQSTFSWAHSSIMRFGALEVPGVHDSFDSAGAFVSSLQKKDLTAHQVDFDVKRSVARGNNGIFLLVAADIAATVKCNITFRTYYTYA